MSQPPWPPPGEPAPFDPNTQRPDGQKAPFQPSPGPMPNPGVGGPYQTGQPPQFVTRDGQPAKSDAGRTIGIIFAWVGGVVVLAVALLFIAIAGICGV